MRKTLPEIRNGLTKKCSACGQDFYITVNFDDENHDPLEVFCVIAKNGSTLAGVIDVWMMTLSEALKNGAKWSKLSSLFLHQRFEPSDQDNPSIAHAIAKSIDELIETRRALWDDGTNTSDSRVPS